MVYLKLVLTALFWGGTFIAGRSLAGTVEPFSAAFLRFLAASLILTLWLLRTERVVPRLSVKDWGQMAILGLTGVFAYNFLFFKGLALIPASRASVIVANNPAAIAVISALVYREPLSGRKLTGVLLSLMGALVVISRGDLGSVLREGVGTGELLILGCVASWTTYSVLGKHVLRRLTPAVSVCGSALLGTAALLPAALWEGLPYKLGTFPAAAWLALGYLGVFGTVFGFVWFYQGVRDLGPTRAGLFINFVPVFAVLLAWLFLSEPITVSLALGAALVCAGVYLTNR